MLAPVATCSSTTLSPQPSWRAAATTRTLHRGQEGQRTRRLAAPVTLDFGPVGIITVSGGAGTMAAYNMDRFRVSRDQVTVYSALPDISTSQQILIGGSFT
jgi:hypothetical protein